MANDKPLNGLQTLYYENGQIKKKQNYKDGTLNGEQTAYFENGQIAIKGNSKLQRR